VAAIELARLRWPALSGVIRVVRGKRVDEASEDAVRRDEAASASILVREHEENKERQHQAVCGAGGFETTISPAPFDMC